MHLPFLELSWRLFWQSIISPRSVSPPTAQIWLPATSGFSQNQNRRWKGGDLWMRRSHSPQAQSTASHCRLTSPTVEQWRTEGGRVGVLKPPHPRNSEGPPKLCQTQPDDTVSSQELHQPIGCSSERWSSPPGKLGDAMSSQALQEPNLWHISSFQEAETYTPMLLTPINLLHCKVYMNALGISYSCFSNKPQHGTNEIAWKLQLISVILAQRWHFHHSSGVPKGGGFGGVQTPRNSEGSPKSCQTQPDCENC